MLVVEWICAALLCASIWWYPARSGWKRIAAPLLSVLGCVGFAVVALSAGTYGIAALNLVLIFINGLNFAKALGRWSGERAVRRQVDWA